MPAASPLPKPTRAMPFMLIFTPVDQIDAALLLGDWGPVKNPLDTEQRLLHGSPKEAVLSVCASLPLFRWTENTLFLSQTCDYRHNAVNRL